LLKIFESLLNVNGILYACSRASSGASSFSPVASTPITFSFNNPTMVRNSAPELSEFEQKRQENIARNKILLGELVLTASETGLAPKKRKLQSTPSSASKKTKRSSPKLKENAQPTRSSSRLRNIPADSEVARLRAEEERQAHQAAERAKKQRISDDVDFSAFPISGMRRNISNNYQQTFSDNLLTS